MRAGRTGRRTTAAATTTAVTPPCPAAAGGREAARPPLDAAGADYPRPAGCKLRRGAGEQARRSAGRIDPIHAPGTATTSPGDGHWCPVEVDERSPPATTSSCAGLAGHTGRSAATDDESQQSGAPAGARNQGAQIRPAAAGHVAPRCRTSRATASAPESEVHRTTCDGDLKLIDTRQRKSAFGTRSGCGLFGAAITRPHVVWG